jgi:hypothetical protein
MDLSLGQSFGAERGVARKPIVFLVFELLLRRWRPGRLMHRLGRHRLRGASLVLVRTDASSPETARPERINDSSPVAIGEADK